jgi:SAM-dependent methyltransferase
MALIERAIRKIKKELVGLKTDTYETLKPRFSGKKGLEIGGPSGIFAANDILPVYADARQVDGVNFSTFTVWEHKIEEGHTYKYADKQTGYQFICEASSLTGIQDSSYDFLLSSHSLEHCANVIKTLQEWARVLVPGGTMVVVVPDKRFTFDHRRTVTEFAHLIEDYRNNVDESDLTHLDEILLHHDISKDSGVRDAAFFQERSMKNIENRCLHHHVFDQNLLVKAFEFLNLRVVLADFQRPHHIVMVAEKPL